MPVTKFKTYEEVWNLACQRAGQLMELGAQEMNWEDILGSDNMTIADFVEKRFIGLPDYVVRSPRRMAAAAQRLEHAEDSPRKRAAYAFLEAYKAMFEENLDKKAESRAFEQVNDMLLYRRTYDIPQDVRNELSRRNRENARESALMTHDIMIFDSLLNSFFSDNAMRGQAPREPIEIEAEQRVFARIAAAMPEGEEFEPFKRREGYVNQQAMVLYPRQVTMVMEPTAATNVTADNYVERIRRPRPDRVTREWGTGTFDQMIEGIYTNDDLDRMKRDKADYLSTVFVDGKSVREWLPYRENETEEAYTARAKCEIVAHALEGKGKVDICPFQRAGDGYTLGNPVPMRVKVNLKEEIPVWKRALRFFHIKSETKKEKAERVSLETLREEERLGAVREQLAVMQERERHRQMAKGAMAENIRHIEMDDRAYFGFLGESGEKVWDELKTRMQTKKSAPLLKTMDRSSSRGNLVRLFALTKGLSLQEVLSDASELNDRKREIGQELVERFTVMDEDEFKKEHGDQADYQGYLREKREAAFHTMEEILEAVKGLPYEPMPDLNPQTLAEFYKRNNFIGKGMNDLFQCISDEVKNVDREKFEALSTEMFSIGEIRHAADFVEAMATDGYVMAHASRAEDMRDIVKAVGARENMTRFRKDTTVCAFWGQVTEHIDENWCVRAQNLRDELNTFSNQKMENARECGRFLEDGKNPVFKIDRETGMYQVKTAREIAGKMQEERLASEITEIEWSDIRNADRNLRLKAQKGTKREEARIQERQRQQEIVKEAMEKNTRFEKRDDSIYFSAMGETEEERESAMHDMARFQEERENIQGKKVKTNVYIMATLPRRPSRMSIVRAYALTKGMTPEEVMSDDPALDERKAEIGKEFLRKINVMGEEEYQKFHGADGDYKQYVAGKEAGMFEMAKEIHKSIMDFPYEPLKDMKPETLAAAYGKSMFIRNISQDFFQVFQPLEENYKEEMDDMSIKMRALGGLDYIDAYCTFLASDSYVRPDTMGMTDARDIFVAVAAREAVGRLMEGTKDFTSCGQVTEKLDEQWARQEARLKVTMADKAFRVDRREYQDAANYLTTGQGSICYFDKSAGEYIVGYSKDIERIRKEKEMSETGKVKVGLDELGDGGKKRSFKKPEKADKKAVVKEELKLEKGGKKGRH